MYIQKLIKNHNVDSETDQKSSVYETFIKLNENQLKIINENILNNKNASE